MNDRPKLTSVAIRFRGEVHSAPAPGRHADLVCVLIRRHPEVDYIDIENESEFGFLDEVGRFLNRKQALINAHNNGQIKDESKVIHNQLFSEALW